MRRRLITSAVLGLGIAASIVFYFSRARLKPSEKDLSSAQDDVYEVVVRDMVTSSDGRVLVSQLVFGEETLAPLAPMEDTLPCEDRARRDMWLENSKLPYDSIVDKAYRLFTRHGYDDTFRPDTIHDFALKFCTPGQLSQTFHTDVPHTFINAKKIHFSGWPIDQERGTSFEERFPGAGGIISFSRVGFDPSLQEAIVATSFICGPLCGHGSRFVLRKRHGRWEVVNKWMVWVA